MKKILLLLFIVLLYPSSSSFCSPNCPTGSSPNNCNVELSYPYTICADSCGKKVLKKVCTNDPNSLENVRKINLPLCFEQIGNIQVQ